MAIKYSRSKSHCQRNNTVNIKGSSQHFWYQHWEHLPICPPLVMCQSPFHPVNSPVQNQFCKICHFTFINHLCFLVWWFHAGVHSLKPKFFSENAFVGITGPLTSGSSHICSSFLQNIEDTDTHLCHIS